MTCVWLGVGGLGGDWVRELGLGFTNSVGTWKMGDNVSVFWLRWCGGWGAAWARI